MPLTELEQLHLPALAQADLIFLLGGAFVPPLNNQDWQYSDVSTSDVESLVARSELPNEIELKKSLNNWIAALQTISRGEHSNEYHRLFEGGMICPLNETAYVRRDKGAIIGDACGFYRAFGWEPRLGTGEKPDHLVFELQFFGVLLTMLAQADFESAAERSEIVRNAIRKFGGDHLGDWLPTVIQNISETTQTDAFRGLTEALRCVWDSLVQYHAIPITPSDAIIPPPSIPTLGAAESDPVDSPYEPCGFESAPGLVQIQSGTGD
jgi:TorA maturation chaperone TorD